MDDMKISKVTPKVEPAGVSSGSLPVSKGLEGLFSPIVDFFKDVEKADKSSEKNPFAVYEQTLKLLNGDEKKLDFLG